MNFQGIVQICIFQLKIYFSFKVKNNVDYYKKKFEHVKGKARKRESYVKEQKETGGGTLSKDKQRIIASPAYTDLALHLGKSAIGNQPRLDSDEQQMNTEPPTERLRNILQDSG